MKTKLLLIALAIFLTIQSFAQSVGDIFPVGDLNYEILSLSPNEVGVKGYVTAPGATPESSITLTIPASVTGGTGGNTYSVVAIQPSAFQGTANRALGVVNFPTTLRSIGTLAFQAGRLLSFSLSNPSALTSIGASAFAGTNGPGNLASVNLSNTSLNFTSADVNIFNNCSQMTSFQMTNNTSVTMLPPAFLGSCTSLQTANFSGCTNIATLGDNVFRSNASLVGLHLGRDAVPTITLGNSGPGAAGTFSLMGGNGLTAADRTLYVPTSTGVSNFQALTEWTDIFGNITFVPTLSVKSNDANNGLTLYPNPTTSKVKISKEAISAKVYTLLGQEAKSFNLKQKEFDVSSLSNGLYLFQAKFENGITETIRFVKK